MKLYVGNMSFDSNEAEVRKAFEAHGKVDTVAIIMDRDTGQPKGFGFVEMSNEAEAKAAIEGLNGKDFMGRTLNVNEARPRAEGPRRGINSGYRRSF